MNHVCLIGNLTRDPELKSTSSGTSVLSFSLAVNERRKVGDEWTDVPNFFDVTLFGKRAESLSSYLNKGSKVGVSGRLRWHQWETPDGSKRSKVDVVADDVDFASTRAASSAPITDADLDEIPF